MVDREPYNVCLFKLLGKSPLFSFFEVAHVGAHTEGYFCLGHGEYTTLLILGYTVLSLICLLLSTRGAEANRQSSTEIFHSWMFRQQQSIVFLK